MAKGKYQEWLTKEGLLKLEGWARDGLTDEQIAKNMGIGIRTFYEWKKKYPQILQVLKKGKEVVDREVENALLKAALGYYYDEDVVTNKGEVVRIQKYEKPNTTAQIFWLKNRKPKEWRDRQELNVEGNLGVQIVDDIEDEDVEDDTVV